jgi:hypothetical protein
VKRCEDRGAAICEVVAVGQYSMTDVGQAFGVDGNASKPNGKRKKREHSKRQGLAPACALHVLGYSTLK